MLNLVVDIGNSRTKVAVFNRGELMIHFPVDRLLPKDIRMLKEEYPGLTKAILSSVKDPQPELMDCLRNEFGFFVNLDATTPLPIDNCYQTPETLGKDRIAAAVGANHLYPNQHVLVIDAGTAITYDYVNDRNQYKGGFITPGLSMRFKALNHFTDRLPLLSPSFTEKPIGLSTETSIQGGIQLGLMGEIRQIVEYFNIFQEDLCIILTGGDHFYFEKWLKNYKFVALEITLLGLNTIVEFNYMKSKKDNL
ncbi:MAG TPA: type III pantothenate kinase [Prolixibacteraceae bacterium]|nr:type III pantothenate kinase [Prolixibacteraceae bacterium]